MRRWARGIIRARFLVLGVWVVVVVLGALSLEGLPSLLSLSLSVPGTSSARAQAILASHFGENPDGTFTVVFRTNDDSRAALTHLSARLEGAAMRLPRGRAGPLTTAPGVVYGEIASPLPLSAAARYTGPIRSALSGRPVAYVTGEPAIQHDLTPILASDLRRGELVAVPIVLVILALTLGISLALVIPVVIAAATIAATLGVVYLLAHVVPMASYAPNLVELLAIGLAVDYSYLLVARLREELRDPARSVAEAIATTMSTAGRAVLFSSLTVVFGLAAVLLVPVPFIRSVALAVLVVPVFSLLATLTLQPALLAVLGRRVEWSRLRLRGASTLRWRGVVETVVRNRAAVLVGGALLVALAVSPIVDLQLTPGSIFAIPHSNGSARGEALLLRAVGAGALTPIDVVIDSGRRGGALSPAITAACDRLVNEVADDREVFLVVTGTRPPNVDAARRYRLVMVAARQQFGAEATQQLVEELRARDIPAARFPQSAAVSVGGAPAEGVDFLDRIGSAFPFVLVVAFTATLLLLTRAFRSPVLALVTVLLDAASVAAAFGMLVIVFRFGVGAGLIGLYRVSQIEGWIPIFVFATLFGLSMDYQVFIVMRMREAKDRRASDAEAIVSGLELTGGVVTAAAAVMVATFCGFLVGRLADLQEFGAGMALGVLLDVTVLRLLVLPSLMSFLGRYAWWFPDAALPSPRARKGHSSGSANDGGPQAEG